MNDMGPRRGMDGFARPTRPAGAPQPQPRQAAPAPAQARMRPVLPQRPMQPAQRPMPAQRPAGAYPAQQRDMSQQQAQSSASQLRQARAPKRGGSSGWKVFLQFVVGLLVIAGVAAAIVALYIRYYQ